MSGFSKIFVTKDQEVAAQTQGFWLGLPDNFVVTGAGPIDKIEVLDARDSTTLWESNAAGPWYAVVVNKAT